MRTFVASILLFASSVCAGEEFYVRFEQSNFLGGYGDSFYVDGNRGLHVRREAKEIVPKWRTIGISDAQISSYVARITQIGVTTWKKDYPENTGPQICDGPTFDLQIAGSGLSIESSGVCDTPNSFEAFVRATIELFGE